MIFCMYFWRMSASKIIEQLQLKFTAYLEANTHTSEPRNLYDPITYILDLGGKRLRPVLCLMTAELFGEKSEEALEAALAIETFHNFTLVHDDIMDDAPLRRGKTTVHEKWDVNTGILSGDAMLILAYQLLEGYPPELFKKLISLFSKTSLQVCEGQQYDIDFETRDDVSLQEYLKMIEYKTAVLVAAAMQMGAMVAEAAEQDAVEVYEFGRNLGIAFQLQDDYLDAFGDPKTFGKQVGGDIMENKKTYLYLKSIEMGTQEHKESLLHLYSIKPNDSSSKIETVKTIFEESGAVIATKAAIETFTQSAFTHLEKLELSETNKKILRQFGANLMQRTV